MKKRSRIIIVIVLFFVTISACIGSYIYKDYLVKQENLRIQREKKEEELNRIKQLELEEQIKKEKIQEIENNIDSLFLNEVPIKGISDDALFEIVLKIEEIEDEEIRFALNEKIKIVDEFRYIEKGINQLLVNGNLISNYKEKDIENLKEAYDEAPDSFTESFMNDVLKIEKQKKNIDTVKKNIRNLFKDEKMTKVKSNVTRSQYNKVEKSLKALPQKDIVSEYTVYLKKVLKVVEEQEEIARKKEEERKRREKEIEEAWVKLNAPYISQNYSEVLNGCEAASLLMGLQYKGYLKNMTLHSFVEAMPKSDNPHEGFVGDPYNLEPRDVPHWIAPDALAKYGKSSSGNNGVLDITGENVSYLKKELDKGNPVVVYVTGGNLNDPKEKVGEIPLNVHVVLLVGYNPLSKQLLVNNPWTKNGNGKEYVSEERFTYIYNFLGKKAVVIR